MYLGRSHWFFLDEWDFVAGRTAWDVDDLLEPHNEHWSTLPILAYRAVYRVFGLGSYRPYLAMAVTAHLAAAVIMRLILRRMGLSPWLASVVLVPWILFGSAWQNILWGFQIGWTGALILTMSQLLVADHDGPLGGRDLVALTAGLGGLLCAGIAVPLVATVGLALLLRRGWRSAAFHTVPLMVVYSLWSSAYGRSTFLDADPSWDKAEFVWVGISEAVARFAWYHGLGFAMVGLTAVGVALFLRRQRPERRHPAVSYAIALPLGAVGFLLVVASGRLGVFGPGFARASRYVHIVSFLLLPLLGLGAKGLIDWSRHRSSRARFASAVIVVGLLGIGIPGNLTAFTDPNGTLQTDPHTIEAVAAAVLDRPDLPSDGQPLELVAPGITIGWLRAAVAEGQIEPDSSRALPPGFEQTLLLMQVDEDPSPAACVPMEHPVLLDMAAGDRVGFSALLMDVEVHTASGTHLSKRFNLLNGSTLEASTPMSVEFTNPQPTVAAEICGGPAISSPADGRR